jgi:4-amino-4-deoxy-L-arabinose transferase-like glycosyltransferase
MLKLKLLIIPILLIAFLLRGYGISHTPSLNPDEAALGYNAYSLLETGKDEHGNPWPIHFKSFGDFKPGGYVYLAMPFVKILGLNPLAVRLPNLILSVLTVFILYKLVLLLSKSSVLALYSSSVLAISPWHIHFSRGAWESSAALFFILLGIYWFYSYIINRKSYFLYLFLLPFIASLYIYHSARLVAPLLVLFLLTTNLKFVIRNLKLFILPCIIAFLLTIPVLVSFLNNGGAARFGGVGLTADYGPMSRSEELLNQHGNVKLINRITHNRRVLYALSWAQKYTSHFDLNFLFINGDEVPRSRSPEMGQLYLIELPLLILGLVFLIKSKLSTFKFFVLSFLFIAPIASSLTFQAPSALRALPMVIPLSILTASGIYYLSTLIHKTYFINLISVFLVIGYLYSTVYFLDSYFIHAPQRYPFAWNRGFDLIVPHIESQKQKYQNIYLTNKYDQPYILYLFFSKYDPTKIQNQIQLTKPDRFGFSTVEKIDNITFYIPEKIPVNSLVIDSSDFQLTGQSFKIYEK